MNRRDLFKFAGLGAAALLVPAELMARPTFFLPPRGGWGGQPFVMRKLQQYIISNDTNGVRYDASWIKPDGSIHQSKVFRDGDFEGCDDAARTLLQNRMIADGGDNNTKETLRLPTMLYIPAKYV